MKEYTLYIFAPEAEFVLPFIKQLMPKANIHTDADAVSGTPDAAVMLSSCDIYSTGERILADETATLDPQSPFLAAEARFKEVCRTRAWNGVILRCADIVGTGMTGFTRDLVNAVYRNFFFHFPGNEARRSVVHAIYIAKVVKAIADGAFSGLEGSGTSTPTVQIYNLTDGEHPKIHDLAEAFAFRLNNKRISNLSTGPQQFIGRLIYGKRRYASYTTTRTFNDDAIRKQLNIAPLNVCEYLRTHEYRDADV